MVGDDCIIGENVKLHAWRGGRIEIGAGSMIGANCNLSVADKKILKVGREFSLGANSNIHAGLDIVWGECGVLGADSQIGAREPGFNGRLTVGDGCQFQNRTIIDLCDDVSIGSFVRSGANCAIYSHNHSPASGCLIWNQKVRCSAVRIGDGVWIGVNCVFLPGVEVGANAVVAAGAVVTKSANGGTIIGGVPARVIGRI